MKASALKYFVLSLLVGLICVIISVMPFHAFLTVWASTAVGHYTLLRLWKEILLLICAVGAFYLILVDTKVRTQTLTRRLVWLIIAYMVWVLARAGIAWHTASVNHTALGYGLIVDLRMFAFFLIAWAVAVRTTRLKTQWPRLLLWPAYGVIVIAVLQFLVLPDNFLSHFGYNAATTIPPYETINHNSHYIRVIATLRGANPLGAYLIIPISLLVANLAMPAKRNLSHIAVMFGAVLALTFSFSRAAWLGALLSVVIVLAVQLPLRKVVPQITGSAVLLLVVVLAIVASLKHDRLLQNVFLHTQDHSAIVTTSNGAHATALRAGWHDIMQQPWGQGPGTAGPASVYNHGASRIAENFFIQLGQELGWLGLGLFMLINAGVGYLLWLRRAEPLALSLFASLIGLSLVNLLSHAWADDTLAYVWWGLAGIAMAQPAYKRPVVIEDEPASTT